MIRSWDHPRSRGVYTASDFSSAGSLWIIPARAGFTRRRREEKADMADHPRSRGVYASSVSSCRRKAGSSPLARGLLFSVIVASLGMRIIPARAGFTLRRRGMASRPWDHPRSRGVYRRPESPDRSAAGSSPLARGLLPGGLKVWPCGRIIPARAGFTTSEAGIPVLRTDHPRSRGVYFAVKMVSAFPSGSSPLARGLRPGPHRPCYESRIIPARAGFTVVYFVLWCK